MGLIFLRNKVASGYTPTDSDAAAYITAVETADGQALEDAVREAIDDFVIGCKADGIWSAIKASCILAGARTLAGALTPLVGTAPTNYNFVSGDYDRKTGLVGDGSTKYLDSNRANNADPQNNIHVSVWSQDAGTSGTNRSYISNTVTSGFTNIASLNTGALVIFNRSILAAVTANGQSQVTGLIGSSRANSTSYDYIYGGTSQNYSATSQGVSAGNYELFRRANASYYSNARVAFYSIGESLALADLDGRVSTLMTDLGNAIP